MPGTTISPTWPSWRWPVSITRRAGTAQAIDLYNELAAKPSETVSAGVAQLDLADLYAAEGKQDQARELWAKVKDADKDGAAGAIAAQKLAAQAVGLP